MTVTKLTACAGVAVFALAGCAAAPMTETAPGLETALSTRPAEARIARPQGEVFKSAMRFFAANNAIVTFADAESGAIYVESLGPAIDRVAECGDRAVSSAVDATSRVGVIVLANGWANSLVSVSTEFTQMRQFAVYPSFRARCDSRGLIEDGLLAYLAAPTAPIPLLDDYLAEEPVEAPEQPFRGVFDLGS